MIIPSYIGIISKNKLFDGGRGTVDSPYRITKIYHFDNMRKFPTSHYRLENDIEFTDEFEVDGEYYNEGLFWTPITNFSGIIDGQNYNINNLKSQLDSTTRRGSIIHGSLSGTFKNIKFFNAIINSGGAAVNNSGGLIGNLTSTGTVENIYMQGSVRLGVWCGGIVGRSSNGLIKQCAVDLAIIATQTVGAIFGGNSSNCRIHDCYSKGTMSASFFKSGIHGSTFGARLERCFTFMSGLDQALITNYDGYNATQVDSYWDRQATGSSSSFAGGTPLYTVEAKYPYQEVVGHGMPYQGWNFDTVWAHDTDGTLNNGYPYLRNVTPID